MKRFFCVIGLLFLCGFSQQAVASSGDDFFGDQVVMVEDTTTQVDQAILPAKSEKPDSSSLIWYLLGGLVLIVLVAMLTGGIKIPAHPLMIVILLSVGFGSCEESPFTPDDPHFVGVNPDEYQDGAKLNSKDGVHLICATGQQLIFEAKTFACGSLPLDDVVHQWICNSSGYKVVSMTRTSTEKCVATIIIEEVDVDSTASAQPRTIDLRSQHGVHLVCETDNQLIFQARSRRCGVEPLDDMIQLWLCDHPEYRIDAIGRTDHCEATIFVAK